MKTINISYKDKFVFAELTKIAMFTRTEKGLIVKNKKYILVSSETQLIEYISSNLNYSQEVIRRSLLRLKLKGYFSYNKEKEYIIINKRIDNIHSAYFYTRIPLYMKKTFYLQDGSKVTWTILDQMIFNYVDAVRGVYDCRCSENEMLLKIKSIFYQKIDSIAEKFGLTRAEVVNVINKFKRLFGKRCFRRAMQSEKFFRKHPYSMTYTLDIPRKRELKKVMEVFEKEKCIKIKSKERIKCYEIDCEEDFVLPEIYNNAI